jgi:4'-phosphopantetheinyl transferase EntD
MLQALFRSPIVSSTAVPRVVDEQLFPEELAYIHRAVPKRRNEFGTARVCAREALAALGVPPVPLVPGPDRAPSWPPGIVGSIAHTNRLCAVVAARRTPVRSLGLDIEPVRHLEPRLAEWIATVRERAFIGAQPSERHDELLILHFSAKEAYYKCQYGLTGEYLNFHDVELDIDIQQGLFCARALRPMPAELLGLTGRFAIVDDAVMCGIEVTT